MKRRPIEGPRSFCPELLCAGNVPGRSCGEEACGLGSPGSAFRDLSVPWGGSVPPKGHPTPHTAA
eukprot:1831820-Alexandrium_andersonii.AAC.1